VDPTLIALAFGSPPVEIVPAPRRRAWMDDAHERWPNRCLPLLVANEAGWVLLNRTPFSVVWDGDERPEALRLEFHADDPRPSVYSHFGEGVLTFGIPYVFRTSPGYNLLARGPANLPKDGIWPLEGLVETDWAFANFTMNWKLTRPGHPVTFDRGEPFCMIVPQLRGELESFRPEIRPIESDERASKEFRRFSERRHEMQVNKFLSAHVPALEGYKRDWERDYYQGRAPSGDAAPNHQTKLHLAPFRGETGD
jgi:hypothetical protein